MGKLKAEQETASVKGGQEKEALVVAFKCVTPRAINNLFIFTVKDRIHNIDDFSYYEPLEKLGNTPQNSREGIKELTRKWGNKWLRPGGDLEQRDWNCFSTASASEASVRNTGNKGRNQLTALWEDKDGH